MKLVVLAGAKKDTAVPLKRDRFVIGRAKECSLRAGSDAISRRHCEITRTAEGVAVRDLGSRNGTYVNDIKIERETPLENGDLIRVGPLEFRFESEGRLNDLKQPKVTDVGEAVARVAEKAKTSGEPRGFEDDVSDWLLDEPASSGSVEAIRETQSFSAEETRALAEQDAMAPEAPAGEPVEEDAEADGVEEEEEEADAKGRKKKKEPGKLPKDAFAAQQPKDSREAAVQILRDMARRR